MAIVTPGWSGPATTAHDRESVARAMRVDVYRDLGTPDPTASDSNYRNHHGS